MPKSQSSQAIGSEKQFLYTETLFWKLVKWLQLERLNYKFCMEEFATFSLLTELIWALWNYSSTDRFTFRTLRPRKFQILYNKYVCRISS